MNTPVPDGERPRQPFLSDARILLAAPTQSWSRSSGNQRLPIDGIYHGDTRFLTDLHLSSQPEEGEGRGASPSYSPGLERQSEVPPFRGKFAMSAANPSVLSSQPDRGGTKGDGIEWVSCVECSAGEQIIGGFLRDSDDDAADPKVRLIRHQSVTPGVFREKLELHSKLPNLIRVRLALRFTLDFAPMQQIKDGRVSPGQVAIEADELGVRGSWEAAQCHITLPEAAFTVEGFVVTATWSVEVPADGRVEVSWECAMSDTDMVVSPSRVPWSALDLPEGVNPDLSRWAQRAWSDLGALRLTLAGSDEQFFAAGAPWYLTLFGRDAIWAARLLLPRCPEIALSTLCVFASLQADRVDTVMASAPGKILHELRSNTVKLPSEGIILPPQYYGSVDSTPLWICLLYDAWRTGAPTDEILDLIPALRASLHWMLRYGDSNGDLFLDYFDESSTGLSNQGWKDSSDSIQWRDGTLAEGPLALCEVQGYAYEAALAGAELLDFAEAKGCSYSNGVGGEITAEELRSYASRLKEEFQERFWVTTPEGRYPAVSLDGKGRAIDSLTSNVGHLIGTGILDRKDEADIARLMLREDMSSGFGIRTLSTRSGGYWPLSYHAGSVWTHDTAVIMRGMAKVGLLEEAALVARQLIRSAVSFDYCAPELFCGDSLTLTPQATPYPASCRPQAWAAASALACLEVEVASGSSPIPLAVWDA